MIAFTAHPNRTMRRRLPTAPAHRLLRENARRLERSAAACSECRARGEFMRIRNSVLGCVVALFVVACGQSAGPANSDSRKADAKPVAAAVDSKRLLAANEEPGEWMAPGRTY